VAGKAKAGICLIPLADETQGVQIKLCYPWQYVLYPSALEMFRVEAL